MAGLGLKIEVTPQALAVIHAVRNETIPQHVIDRLTEAEQAEANAYNDDLLYLHWHVKDDTHDLAFKTEMDADEFLNQLWHYLTAGDEDRDNEVEAETVKCHNHTCRVYVG